MWIREPDCREIIESGSVDTNQEALVSTIQNIKKCADNLEAWNHDKFGSLARDIKLIHQQIIQIRNNQAQNGDTSELRAKERELNELLLNEEIF